MSKKRPRPTRSPCSARPCAEIAKTELAYWAARLFKNTYTTKGRIHQTRRWCVKVQYHRIRRTFSLLASLKVHAATEACLLYRAIREQGWEQVLTQRNGREIENGGGGLKASARKDERQCAAYWEQQLVRRDYRMESHFNGNGELSARIEHESAAYYFLLGTADRNQAAAKALNIYREVATKGWEAANQKFSRELTVAFHWLQRPLAWTYATIHTLIRTPCKSVAAASENRDSLRRVVVVESDAGIRQALAWCINQMDGFTCAATFASEAEAVRKLRRSQPRVALVSSSLAAKQGVACVQQLQLAVPEVTGVLYSVYEDSEKLFGSTPGGATNYLLQRTASTQFLAPLAAVPEPGRLSDAAMSLEVWQYFKNVFSLPPPAGFARPAGELTQREHEVLTRLSKGSPDKDIADRLGISIHTVHEHVRNIFEKLGAHNRTEAVVKFLQK